MPTLHIRLTKKPDGSSVFACARTDGSTTWQRHKTDFLPLHDLNHFALESTSGLWHGFYGLVGDGWSIADFGERDIAEHAEQEAILAEAIAGLFDQERATGIWPNAEGFNEALSASLGSMDHELYRTITQKELDAIRSRFMELASQWGLTSSGGSLELEFALSHQ